MSEWRFPNAIAESVKRSAVKRGQHAGRREARDPDDKWPAPPNWVKFNSACAKATSVPMYHATEKVGGEICKYCGAFVTRG